MENIIIVEESKDWKLQTDKVRVMFARDYIRGGDVAKKKGVRVYNLCRSYTYNSMGYYVSLLASARGHKPSPSVEAIQDLKSISFVRIASEGLDKKIQSSLKDLKSDTFEISLYFRMNMAKKYDVLCRELSRFFQAPLVRAFFKRSNGKWYLRKVHPIGLADIPDSHWEFIQKVADKHFSKNVRSIFRKQYRFSLAILTNPEDEMAPSNPKALNKFVNAAQKLGIDAELITNDDYTVLGEYDGLFIRETTAVNHHTFRFAQKANALGLVVIDDPTSILRCSNKVFIHEILVNHGFYAPKTEVVDSKNVHEIADMLVYPSVLKKPDGSFSKGVIKVNSKEEFVQSTLECLERSELVIVQEFIPTAFDWRVGVFDNKAIFVCKYFMVKGHWQIYKHGGPRKKFTAGEFETIPVELAPKPLIDAALNVSQLIGDGLYGVDIKELDGKFYVIEVNDNPNIDAGVEDRSLGEKLYLDIMHVFLSRMLKKVESVRVSSSKN